MPTIKFGNCFAEFMIQMALLKEFGRSEFVMTIKVTDMRKWTYETSLFYDLCITDYSECN